MRLAAAGAAECEPVNGVCGMAGLRVRIDRARVCVGAGVRGRLLAVRAPRAPALLDVRLSSALCGLAQWACALIFSPVSG